MIKPNILKLRINNSFTRIGIPKTLYYERNSKEIHGKTVPMVENDFRFVL